MTFYTNEMISLHDPSFLQIPLLSFNKNKQDIDIDESKYRNLSQVAKNIENVNCINIKKLSSSISQDRIQIKLRNQQSLQSHGQSQNDMIFFSPNGILKLKYYFSEIDPINDKIIENKFQREIFIFIQRIPVFNPTSKFMILWKLFQTSIIAFYFFEIPIYLSWGDVYLLTKYSENLITVVKSLSLTMLVADIFLEFITSFYLHGNLITIKSKIAHKYLQQNFSYDIIAVSSFFIVYIIQPNINYQFMIIFFFFKIKWLLKFNQQVEEMLLLKPTLSALWGVFKIIVFMFQCIIIFACCFYSIGIYAIKNNQNSWLLNSGNFGIILNKSSHEQFYFAFYFSLALFTTVMGYGDITPLNIYECSFCLFGIIFAVLVFALNFNKIELLIQNYDQFQKSQLTSQISMQQFFKSKGIQPQISEKVRQYLNEQIYSEKYRDKNLEQTIIEELAPELKEQLLFAAYGIIFQNQPIFNDFSQNLLQVLSTLVKETFYSEGAILFQDNNQDDNQSFYYIFVGQILLYHNFKNGFDQEQKQIKKLKNGDSFGEWSFMTGQGRKASAKAHSLSILYEIKRSDFINTLGRFQNDFELFHSKKEQLIFGYQNLVNQNNKCWTCLSMEHYAMDCPKSHYLPQIETIIQEQEINSQQERIKYERFNRNIWRTLQKSQSLIKTSKGRTNQSNNIIYELKMIANNRQNQFQNQEKNDQIQQIRQELQKQFERQSIVDFDKVYQFKNYFPESNIANYWTADGTLKINNNEQEN